MSRRSTILSLFAVIVLSILGVILAQSIPNAVFPEFVFHRAIILADSAELPASQVLVAVTRPLEEAAYSVPGTTLWVTLGSPLLVAHLRSPQGMPARAGPSHTAAP